MSANAGSQVVVHSKLTVVSDTPIPPGKTYQLSVLDHAMGFHTLHFIFYYRCDRSDVGLSSDLGRLREALSEVLTLYPPVTGRLKRDEESGNWVVKCNDAGVRILKAKVKASLDEWLQSASGSKEERNLTAWEEMPEEPNIWSPFRVQMNEFEGGGLAIGLSCPHMQADPTCATILMKSWTDLYRRVSISHPPFFHPPSLRGRATPNTNTKSAKYYESKSKIEGASSTRMSTITFKFSEKMTKKFLTIIQSNCPNATPFDMLAAVFWVSISKIKTQMGKAACKTLSLCIDFRKRMHAPLPHGFFGNALHFSQVSCDQLAGVDEVLGLDSVTVLIHEHLSSLEEEEYWSTIDWFESKKGKEGKFPTPFRMYGPELTCANLEHLPAYGAVVENLKPEHVSLHVGNVNGEGLILVLPSSEEGLGRTVIVTLPEDEASELCENSMILSMEPVLLFNGR